MVYADETTKCAYCHEAMSIIEGITEYGKWYHQDCMIHKLSKEIEDYKKKWIDGKLSKGDKVELLDMFNLRQNMIADRTEFKGLQLVAETSFKRNMLTDEPLRQMVYLDNQGIFPLLKDGKMVCIEDNAPTIDMRVPKLRPVVEKKPIQARKQIEMQELPKLLGIPEVMQ